MNVKTRLASLAMALALIAVVPLGAAVAQDASPVATPYDPQPTKTYDKTNWPDELTCGLFGGDDAEAALENNEPLARHLEEWLGIEVNYTTGSSYNAVIEAAKAGHVDCYTVGPFAYILGVEEANAEALAINISSRAENPVYDPSLQPAYYSVISTKKGSGIDSVDDLRGRSFSFVDPASTSGHLIPRSMLVEAGLNPDSDMETIFAGSHPTSGIALWNDKVDAAASTETTLANLAAEGQIKYCTFADGEVGKPRTQEEIQAVYDACPDGHVVAIAFSDPIPSTPFTVNKNLPASLKEAIKDALLATKEDAAFIAETGRWFTDPNIDQNLGLPHLDSYYDGLREVAKVLDLDLKSFEE
jgi:phosphonate transport system substrate-binding protein